MVKITFKPWEELVVHETIKYELKELIELKTRYLKTGQGSEALLWAEGVVFTRTIMPPTDDVVRDQLKGIIHYSSVEYAMMPKYKKNLVSGGRTVPIIDAGKTPALRDMARELRQL